MQNKRKKIINFIRESIARNTPTRPEGLRKQILDKEYLFGYCPNCKLGAFSYMEVCVRCGQKFDWREKDESKSGD